MGGTWPVLTGRGVVGATQQEGRRRGAYIGEGGESLSQNL